MGLWCDGSGNIFVAEGLNCRVSKFDNNGNFVMMFGSCGTGPTQFRSIYDVATDSQGNIYTFSWFRVQKFSPSGQFITQWGEEGDGEGKFKAHGDIRIVVSKDDSIYTYDDNDVQKWDRDGNFIRRLSSQSSQPGRFDSPSGVAFSNAGELFVADRDNHRLQKFDRKGALEAAVGSKGSGNAQFNGPRGMAVSDEEIVIVADTGNHRIQVFNKKLEFLAAFGSWGMGPGQFDTPIDVAADRDGNLYVVDNRNLRVQKFDKTYHFMAEWPASPEVNLLNPTGVGTDNQTQVYVADTGNKRVCKFDADGNLMLSFGRYEAVYADLDSPSDVAVDNAGRIFVADGTAVKVFDALGQGLFSIGEGAFGVAFYLDILNNGDVLVSDAGRDQIMVYSRSHGSEVAASARTPGGYGTQWRTDLGLFNTEAVPKEITLAFYPSGRDNTDPPTIGMTLQPSGSAFLPDVVAAFGLTEGVGALGIFPAAGDYPLVFSRTYNQTAEGTYGQFIPGVDFGETFRQGRSAHLTGLKSGTAFRTNVGFVNQRDGPLELVASLYDDQGIERTVQTIALDPYAHLQINDVPGVWGITEDMEGAILIARTEDPYGRFAAYASVVDNRTGDPIFIPAAPPPPIESEKLDQFIPVAAKARGAFDSDWRTEVNLANLGSADLAVTLDFWEHDIANVAPRTETVSIPMGSAVEFEDILGELFGLSDTFGTLLIRPDCTGLIAHARIHHAGAVGTHGQFVPAVRNEDRLTSSGYLLEYHQDEDRRTNIGLINFSENEASYLIELLNGGEIIRSEIRTVQSHSMTQFPGPWGGVHFTLRVTPQGENPSYFAYASLVDNRTQDPVFQPAR
jgi:DNA-binding beta-propeller fold protein YncE